MSRTTTRTRTAAPYLATCAVAALLGGVPTPSVDGASFDCTKASTVAEKTICSNPRLSKLDEELAATYRDASALTVSPRELKSEQIAWLKKDRTECEGDAECLEHSMLVRIATMRTAAHMGVKLFAETAPPKSIFGRYSTTDPVCTYAGPNGEVECEGESESYIDLRPGTGNRVLVRSELMFFNGHICDFEGEGEWVADELRVPSELEDFGCVLILRFRDGKVITDDPGTRCKSYYCGARGGFAFVELPKLSPEETEAKRNAAAPTSEP